MRAREVAIGAFLLAAIAGCGLFIFAYATTHAIRVEGLGLCVAAAGLCGAVLGFAFWVVPYEQVTDAVHGIPSAPGERALQREEIRRNVSLLTRNRALLALFSAAFGSAALAAVVPLRSLGPGPDRALFHTKWRKGDRVARADGKVVRAGDLGLNEIETVFPERAVGDPNSQAALIRLTADGDAAGYVAYSRVCTHAGCPVAIYRAAQQQLLCPCHQSAFDVANGGGVVAGPADRALPRLPLGVATDGTLVALGDFPTPVGPGFWEMSS